MKADCFDLLCVKGKFPFKLNHDHSLDIAPLENLRVSFDYCSPTGETWSYDSELEIRMYHASAKSKVSGI